MLKTIINLIVIPHHYYSWPYDEAYFKYFDFKLTWFYCFHECSCYSDQFDSLEYNCGTNLHNSSLLNRYTFYISLNIDNATKMPHYNDPFNICHAH